ncbi:MAG TPA: lipid II flippase MurJ, partial [Candidatus Paceibacterota bacterium]
LSKLEEESESAMISFMRSALLLFFVSMSVISAVIAVFAPQIIERTVPGFVPGTAAFAQLVLLSRILLLQPILLGISNILANLTQLRHRFLLYSISPLLYNIGIIAGIVALYPHLGTAGLGWGVVLGALLHALVQAPFFASERSEVAMPWDVVMRHMRSVLALSVPRTLALASTQITLVALVALASFFAKGSIAIFSFAYNLQAVPIAIIGVSYSVAAFPTLSRLYAKKENGTLVSYLETALRHILFWSIPATILIIVLRAQLVRVILGAGAFDWSATKLTAAALALFIISLAAQNLTLLIARAYYAAGNSHKPLYFGIADIAVSIIAALSLSALFHKSLFVRLFIESLLRVDSVSGGTTVLMLALGYALGSISEAVIGYVYFMRDFAIPSARVVKLVFQSFAASVIGGAGAYAVLGLLGPVVNMNTVFGVFIQGFAAGITGIAIVVIMLALLGSEELIEIGKAVHRKFMRTERVALEPTDIESAL